MQIITILLAAGAIAVGSLKAEPLKVDIDQFGITSHVNAVIISPGDREPLFEPVYNARVVSAPESFGALRVHPIESWRAGLTTGRVIYIRLVEEN